MVDIITEIGKDAGSLGFLSLQALTRFGGDFGRPVSASKNSVPGGQSQARNPTALAAGIPRFCVSAISGSWLPRCSYSGLSPSASNCRLHSVGGSRRRSMPMPRGRWPSTAALTRFGARKASHGVDGVKQSDLRHREPHSVFERFDLRLGMFAGRSLEQDVVAGLRIKGRIEINQVDALVAQQSHHGRGGRGIPISSAGSRFPSP
jgi:hypothetical protein